METSDFCRSVSDGISFAVLFELFPNDKKGF